MGNKHEKKPVGMQRGKAWRQDLPQELREQRKAPSPAGGVDVDKEGSSESLRLI